MPQPRHRPFHLVPVCAPRAVCLWLTFIAVGPLAAQVAAEPELAESVLIRNVRLLDRSGELDDTLVSLLIKDGKLKLVTKDRVHASEAELVLDGAEGVALGRLDLGELASLIVLDEDPRDNVEVLLDTATHARFAIVRGQIVLNHLVTVGAEEEETGRGAWLAYTPPPFALPLSYDSKRKWNRFEIKPVSGVVVAAVLMDRQRWFSQDEESEEQVGDLDEFSRAEIRGLRVGLVGTLNFKRPWVYTIFGATTAFDAGFDAVKDDDFTLLDYRLDIPLRHNISVSVGKQKEPISMERLTGGVFLPIFERSSVSDSMLPSRNVGVVFNGITAKQNITWAVGAFNDWFDASQDIEDGATQFIGRFTGTPFASANESNLLHLGIGARYSDAEEGVRYRSKPESNLAPTFVTTDTGVDSGFIPGDSAMTYNLEVSWRRGPQWLHYEYLRTEVRAPTFGDPVFSGYHLSASWILTGEMRSYNRRSATFRPVPVARSVYEGGWGSWELALRWSELDLTENVIEGGEMQILAAALNWNLTRFFMIQAHYRHVELERFGLTGSSDGILTRAVLLLE